MWHGLIYTGYNSFMSKIKYEFMHIDNFVYLLTPVSV